MKISKILTCFSALLFFFTSVAVSAATASDETQPQSTQASRVIGYVYGWQTPPDASALAKAGYTHVIIAFGLFSTTEPGTINIDSVSGFDLATYVKSCHDAGLKVMLSLGGASTNIPNTTVNFDDALKLAESPAAFIDTFAASMAALTNTYGFDGFDFDIEWGLNASTSFTDPNAGCRTDTYSPSCDISYLSGILHTFHTRLPNQLLSLAPQVANVAATSSYSSVWANYAALVMQVHDVIDWVGFQTYNSGCAFGIDLICYPTEGNTLTSTPDAAVAFATDLLENWPAKTASGQITHFLPYTTYLKPSQVVLGYTVENGTGQSDGAPPAIPSVVNQTIQCLRSHETCGSYVPPRTYPDIGGVFAWTVNYDTNNSYAFAKTVSPCVSTGQCTTGSDSIDHKCICIQQWKPVCGSDGRTYSNACWAKCAKVEVVKEGRC